MKKILFGSSVHLTGELVADKQIIQTFTAHCENLSEIGVDFGTYRRINNNAIILLEIMDFDEIVIKSCALNCSNFKDNEFQAFNMDCKLIKSKKYILKISNIDGEIGCSVTCKWGKKNNISEKFCIDDAPKMAGELHCYFLYGDSEEIKGEPVSEEKEVKEIKGLVSIIIPIFNGSEYLDNTLSSIKNQTYNYYEISVINDGSTEEESEKIKNIIDKYNDLKIDYFESSENKGASFARNFGRKNAKGEYLFFCDADIVLDSKIFQKMIQCLNDKTQASWCYCDYIWGTKKMTFRHFSAIELKRRNYCSTMSLIKAKDFTGFDPELKRLQDWDLFLTMLENGKSGWWVDEFLFKAEERPGITNNSISWDAAVAELKKKHPTLGKL